MPEGLQPTRQYKWFRPRQAARFAFTTPVPVHKATLYLFNDSQGPLWIVVREFYGLGTDFIAPGLGVVQGKAGTIQNNVIIPVVLGDSILAGQLYYADTATVITPNVINLVTNVSVFLNFFPLVVLAPGWSLVVQDGTDAISMSVTLMWECIYPDQLDAFGEFDQF